MDRPRVLVVDDEEELAFAMAQRLGIRGVDAEACSRGADSVTRVLEDAFDVAILDIKMPGIDGLELMRIMQATRPNLKIILFSGHGAAPDRDKGLEEGAYAYFLKPFDIDELVSTIREAASQKAGSQ